MRKGIIVFMGGIFISLFFVNTVFAMPTFARKYRTSCNTCHIAYPKLTAFGESYRLNGYQIPEGEEAYIKEEPVSMGAPAWKKVWPEAVWPGTIPGPVPISVRIISDFKVNEAAQTASTEFDFPHEVEVMMAGLLGENIPFFAEIEFEGGATETEAWLGFYNLFSNVLPQRSLNLKVGSIGIDALRMANPHLRLGKNYYLFHNWQFPSANSVNRFRLRDARAGLELNGIVASRFWYGTGVVQGDNATDKDGYVTLRYKFGGTPFDKSAPTTGEVDKAIEGKASGFWVDNALELATFAYYGRTEVTGDVKDSFNRWGVGLRQTWQNLDLATGFVLGDNNDPFGSSSAEGVNSESWFIEAGYVLFPWLIPTLRYEALEVDRPTDYSVTNLDQARWVPALIFQIRPNIKLVAEGLLYSKYKQSTSKPDSFAARLDFSF